MANRMKTGVKIITTILLTLSLIVFGILANTGDARAAQDDCLLLVLDSADGSLATAGITISLLDHAGNSHDYSSDANGLVHVPCGLLGERLELADGSGRGYCIMLDSAGSSGSSSSLVIGGEGIGIATSPQASESGHGMILRLGLGPAADLPTDN